MVPRRFNRVCKHLIINLLSPTLCPDTEQVDRSLDYQVRPIGPPETELRHSDNNSFGTICMVEYLAKQRLRRGSVQQFGSDRRRHPDDQTRKEGRVAKSEVEEIAITPG